MNELMKAIVLSEGNLAIQHVKKPQEAAAGHIVLKMTASAINPGDKFFLKRPSLPGAVRSLYEIRGVSGVGTVLQIGDGVPAEFLGKQVTVYRQLAPSDSAVGMWSEYAHVHYLDCAILPDDARPDEYAGSLVNTITPYAFLKQVQEEGHKGIIATAGSSATAKALLGICLTYDFPLISIVRNERGRQELEELGARNILVQSDADFNQQLNELGEALSATAIFEGIGGEILNKIIPDLPRNSVIYSYGYLGDSTPLNVHLSTLVMKNLTLKFFSNFGTKTVQNPESLELALKEIGKIIYMPHFKTSVGKVFSAEQIEDAVAYNPGNGEKALIKF